MKNNISKAAGAVSGMTLLSRIFGFARDMFIAMAFGSSTAADAFFVAFRIPNMQRRVLGEGAVASAFIPVFSETLENHGQQAAEEIDGLTDRTGYSDEAAEKLGMHIGTAAEEESNSGPAFQDVDDSVLDTEQ